MTEPAARATLVDQTAQATPAAPGATRPVVAAVMGEGVLDRLFDDAARVRLAGLSHGGTFAELVGFEDPQDEAVLADIEVLVTGWGCPRVDASVLDRMPRLRSIVHSAGSVKWLLDTEVWDRGITVTSQVDANAWPVAEYTLGVILLANKSFLPSARAYAAEPATFSAAAAFPRIGGYGKRVGIIGASRIGRLVIGLLDRHHVEVLVADPFLTADEATALGVRLADVDEIVATSDVVSVHAPSLPSTRHLVDGRRLGLLRDGATLVNTSRGALLDHDALVAELARRRDVGETLNVVLDVTEPEPLPATSPLFADPWVVVTPHIAGSLGTELGLLAEGVLDELTRLGDGRPPAHPVTREELARSA
ncbi:Phosphoglycerate dehydrogenase [Sanguibacter gelidistatuariae]|uniref:Phosphoglycerate dehydrogenase n=1 Tax=Sanguibacter gelidistatuariae TaxID=1814289 RepID=A0A1G6GXK3_9MICO|nr:hydroxyacid dehydrogenase [Sanguibacter gelidistatuariae]SDB86719.1 Phosphoglycerate dehydrogenase [Sanguibacter gelidistatuariae]